MWGGITGDVLKVSHSNGSQGGGGGYKPVKFWMATSHPRAKITLSQIYLYTHVVT